MDEQAIRAAATMPCDKTDLGEAMIPQALAMAPAESAAKAKEEMRAGGYDPDKPNVDRKFLISYGMAVIEQYSKSNAQILLST